MKLSRSRPTITTCQYPKSFFSFVLKFLLWDRNPMTKVCSSCPFYVYSRVFVGLNMMVHLFINSYRLVNELFKSEETPADAGVAGDDWILPIRLWRYQITLRLTTHYMQLFKALFSVQTMARGLYYLLVLEEYAPLLSWVISVPVLLVLNVASSVVHYKKNCADVPEADSNCRKLLLEQSVSLLTSIIFWTNLCCLLYNRYVNCTFE